MKKFLLTNLLIMILPAVAFADSVQLRDGRTITGKLIERNSYQIVIRDESGMLNRFYNDQVANVIEGEVAAPVTIDQAQFEGISSRKVGLIIRLLGANGTQRNLEKNIKDTIAQAPGPRKEEFKKIFDLNEILSKLIPVYDRYFSEEELSALVEFYESAAGQKLIQISSDLVKDAAQASLQYFEEKLTQ